MEKFLIIDSHSLLHRAYHAIPPLRTKQGDLVNAVYGFLSIFFKAVEILRPNFVAATFDLPGPTFRHQEFQDYQAKRPVHPKEFYQQIPETKESLGWFNVPIFEKPGFEADDIIGTISALVEKEQKKEAIETIILSNDLDMLQLVNDRTKVWVMKKGVNKAFFYGIKEVEERFQGIRPSQLIDFRGLKGDPSDNIPGVPGVGGKTAIRLIKEFGSLANLYQEIEKPEKRGEEKIKAGLLEKLKKYKEQAFFSKKLSEIKRNVPLDIQIEECRFGSFDRNKAEAGLKKLGFYSLLKRMPLGGRLVAG